MKPSKSEEGRMTALMKYGFCRWVRTARGHVWLGIVVFTVACYFMITGTYENLPARVRAETILNAIGLVSLFYATVAWYLHFFLNPRLPPVCPK
jgi:hypothetical protein